MSPRVVIEPSAEIFTTRCVYVSPGAVGGWKEMMSPTRRAETVVGSDSTRVPTGATSPIDGVATTNQRPPPARKRRAVTRVPTAAKATMPAMTLSQSGRCPSSRRGTQLAPPDRMDPERRVRARSGSASGSASGNAETDMEAS